MLNFPPLGMLKNRRKNRGVLFCLVWFSLKVLFYFNVSTQLQKFPDYDLFPAVPLPFKEENFAGRNVRCSKDDFFYYYLFISSFRRNTLQKNKTITSF